MLFISFNYAKINIMKKIAYTFLIITSITLIALILCCLIFKKDYGTDTIIKPDYLPLKVEYKNFVGYKNVTIDGVDYLQSQLPDGIFVMLKIVFYQIQTCGRLDSCWYW